MAGSNIKLFAEQIESFRENTHERTELILKDAARKTLARLCANSPIRTGRYCLSHKVGLNRASTDTEPNRFTRITDRRTIVGRARGIGQQVIMRAKETDTIVINNTAHYASRVEYLGWPAPPVGIWTGEIGPYHVYGLTTEEMRHKLKDVIVEFRNKKI